MMRLKNTPAAPAAATSTTPGRKWSLAAKRGAASAVGAGVLAAGLVMGGGGTAAAVTPGVAKLCNQAYNYKTWVQLSPSGRSSFMASPGQCVTINIYGDTSADYWAMDEWGNRKLLRVAAWSSSNTGIDAYAYSNFAQAHIEYYKN